MTLKLDEWPRKTMGHHLFATSNFVHHFVAISQLQMELQSRKAQFGSKSAIFCPMWPWIFVDDLYTPITRLVMEITGGHRKRVAAVTLDNMAEDAVAASASLWPILTVSVRYCGPAFMSWLSMLWDTLTRNSELQWFGISPQFRLKLSRGDEGVGHVCFPGDEGVGRP